MAQKRVQVDSNVRPDQLRPQARPVDGYSRPAPPPDDQTLANLANSLSQFNPALSRFGQDMAIEQRAQSEDRAEITIGGETFEQSREAIKNGRPQFDDPWFKAAYTKLYGMRTGAWRAEQMTKDYENAFDKTNGNIESFIAEQVKTDAESLGADKFSLSGYNSVMTKAAMNLRAHHAKAMQERVATDKLQGVRDVWRNDIKHGLAAGLTEDEILAQVRARYDGNKQTLNIDYATQDKELLALTAELAKDGGNYSLVRKLLTDDRGGVGSVAGKRDLAPHAREVLAHAKKNQLDADREKAFPARLTFMDRADVGQLDRNELDTWRKKNPHLISDEQALSLVRHNDNVLQAKQKEHAITLAKIEKEAAYRTMLDTILENDIQIANKGGLSFLTALKHPNREGHETEMSAEARRNNVINAYIARSPQIAAERKETPEQSFARERGWFELNGVVNPQWKQVLASAGASASAPTITGENAPPALKAGLTLYMQMYAQNARQLRQHVGDDSDFDFFESYRIAKQFSGMDDQQALMTAIQYTRDPTQHNALSLRQRYDDIASAVNNIGTANRSFLFWGQSVDNLSHIGLQLESLSRFYARQGLSAENSLEQAKARILATHAPVNGWLVPTMDRHLPPNFGKMAEAQIEQYAKANGVNANILTIRQLDNGTGAWVIVRRDNGMPVNSAEGRIFTQRDLVAREQSRLDAVHVESASRINASNQKFLENLNTLAVP